MNDKMEWVKAIVEKVFESWGIIMSIFAVVTVLIFSPAVRIWTGVDGLYTQYRGLVSLLWLFVCARIAWQGCVACHSKAKNWIQDRNRKKYMLKTLQELSPGEKEILSSFKGNDTQWLSMENEYVTALHNKEVLTLASSIAKRMGRAFEQELSCQYRFDPLARELYRSLEHHQ